MKTLTTRPLSALLAAALLLAPVSGVLAHPSSGDRHGGAYHGGHGHDGHEHWRSDFVDLDGLNRRITALEHRDLISSHEAKRLRRMALRLDSREWHYREDGELSRPERRKLRARQRDLYEALEHAEHGVEHVGHGQHSSKHRSQHIRG